MFSFIRSCSVVLLFNAMLLFFCTKVSPVSLSLSLSLSLSPARLSLSLLRSIFLYIISFQLPSLFLFSLYLSLSLSLPLSIAVVFYISVYFIFYPSLSSTKSAIHIISPFIPLCFLVPDHLQLSTSQTIFLLPSIFFPVNIPDRMAATSSPPSHPGGSSTYKPSSQEPIGKP